MIHTEHLESRAPAEAVREFLDGDDHEFYFAVSEDFYEIEAQDQFERIYAEYESYYHELAQKLIGVLGEPSYRGEWQDDDFPDWAVGEQITVWASHQPPLYLRIQHEDQELPILITLARPKQ